MEVDDGRLAQELGRPVLVVQLRVQREDVLERQGGLLSPVLEIRLPGKKAEKRGEARLRTEINFSREENHCVRHYWPRWHKIYKIVKMIV